VDAPERTGEPAVVQALIFNPRDSSGERVLRAGMIVMCSLKRPGQQSSIHVPRNAILSNASEDEANQSQFAPQFAPGAAAPLASNVDSEGAGRGVVAILKPMGEDETHVVEWRTVELGAVDGVQQQIVAGLEPGERIALQPTVLRALGPDVPVRLSSDA
jgi:hypothetical protein